MARIGRRAGCAGRRQPVGAASDGGFCPACLPFTLRVVCLLNRRGRGARGRTADVCGKLSAALHGDLVRDEGHCGRAGGSATGIVRGHQNGKARRQYQLYPIIHISILV